VIKPSPQRSAVHRIACAVVAAELRRQRGAHHPDAAKGNWPSSTLIGDGRMGLGPIEQLGALGVLAETFVLDDSVFGDHANGRLKAFVVAEEDCDLARLSSRIEQAMVIHLTDHERPKSFRFGPALPRNAMGKLEDWP
jgi:hypothetical protein